MNLRDAKTNFKALFALEPGEKSQAILMFLYNFILLNTLYLLKPVRDSLFLEEAGPQNLPFVFLLTAVVVIPISMGYLKLSRKASVGWVINIVTLFLAVNLFLFWFFINSGHNFIFYGFYVWVSIYGVLITSQFWLFANTIFNPVQARKVFNFLSLGAIAGSVTGGELTAVLVNVLSLHPESLLLICAFILVGTTPLVKWILAYNPEEERVPRAVPTKEGAVASISINPIKEILNNNHLLLITGLIGITVIVTTLIDYQFKTVAENAFETEAALTGFMGKFYGRVSLIAFVLQFFLGTYFTKKYGVSGTIMILPVALLLSSAGMLMLPGLVAGTITRGIDQSLKHSIDRAGRELLFIPLGTKLKKRVKVFVDLFVDHGAQGITGLLLLLLTFGLGFNVQELSIVIIALLLFWIVIAKMVSNSYVDQFRISLKKQVDNNWENKQAIKREGKRTTKETLYRLVKSSNESDVLTALKKMRKSDNIISEDFLRELLDHPNSKVRLQTLRLLRKKNLDNFLDEVIDLVYDTGPEVRMEAIRYIYQFYEDDWEDNLKIGLHHNDARIRAVTLGLIAEEGGPKEKKLVTNEMLKNILEYKGEEARELRRQAAHVLGEIYTEKQAVILSRLLHDEEPAVVEEAIVTTGKVKDRRFVHNLILFLGDEVHRKTAEKALAEFNSSIFGTLYDNMMDPEIPESIRRYIPWLFSKTPNEDSWIILQMSLRHCSIPIRHGVIKALQQMRIKNPKLQSDEEMVIQNTEMEIARYSKLVISLEMCRTKKLKLPEPVIDIIAYETAQAFENIFRLLSLNHNPEDISNAYYGITGNDPQMRMDAIEFIENLISWDIRKLLLPVLEHYPSVMADQNRFSSELKNPEDVLTFLGSLEHAALKVELENDNTNKDIRSDKEETEPSVKMDSTFKSE